MIAGPASIGDGIMIIGKARIDLPKYRLRGACRIVYVPPDDLRLDFRHSSLFGAYKEDTSIFLRAGNMIIYDRARDRFFENDSSLAILAAALDIDVFPDDLLYALLLRAITCEAIDSIDMRGTGGEWDVSGMWRGRRIALSGRGTEGAHSFEICSSGETVCYKIRYSYSGGQDGLHYPRRITVAGKRSDQKISLEVLEIKKDIDISELYQWSVSGG